MEQKLLKAARSCAFSLCVLISLGALGACGDDGDSSGGEEEGNTSVQGPPTGVRVFSALDGTASVDVVFLDAANSEVRVDGVSSSSASDYRALDVGTYRAVLFAGGSPLGITVENIQVTSSSVTTLAFTNDGQGEIKNQIFEDDLSAPASGSAKIRFAYRADGVPTDLYNQTTSGRVQDSLILGSVTSYQEVEAGTFSFELRPEGISSTLYPIKDLSLVAGGVYTVFVLGDSDPNGDGDPSDQTLRHVFTTDYVHE